MDIAKMRAALARNRGSDRGFSVTNLDDGSAIIRIYQEIGFWGVTADDIARELDRINATEIEVQISSPGGDVFDGLAIYNALRAHSARITTRIDGVAASAASYIAQAGDHRVILTSAQVMIHEAQGVAFGDAATMREFADLLDRQNGVIADIYATRSGRDAEEFRAAMAAETWYTAQEAVDAGLADEVYEPPRQDATNSATPTAAGFAFNGDPAAIRTLIDAALKEHGIEPRTTEAPNPADGSSVPQAAAQELLAAFFPQEGNPHE